VGVLLDKMGMGNKVVQGYLYALDSVQTQTMGMMFHVLFSMS
jgi:hypothetical protein